MKKLITVLCLVLLSINVHAEQTLSRSLVQQYAKSTESLNQLMKAYPNIDNQIEDADIKDVKGIVKMMKSLPIYSKIEEAVTDAGFDDIEQYLNVSFRIMGALYKAQMQKMPANMSMDAMTEQLQKHIDDMKKRGMPEDMIRDMEDNLKEQSKDMANMKIAAELASEQDVRFVSENQDWLMSVMPLEPDDEQEMAPEDEQQSELEGM